ncbi:hypothetical protein [Aquimarina sp. 2201CG5-10]|uniref:hypothetical protein n=1 Tax=Aquimarina callyspongiae TaxID=3098150 RepID=UPI002AB56E92|nr:hypothetical protein [Aquimarina sp. 2201CG5-10]MDY8134975.1 hypothetical protein [Aquimarina sp. 2201CG5-10]
MAAKKGLGCFFYPAIVLLSIIGSGVVQTFIPISTFQSFAFLLVIFSWLFGKIQKSEENPKGYSQRYFLYSLLLLGVILGVRFIFSSETLKTEEKRVVKNNISEEIFRKKIFEEGDSIVLLSQNREWYDNYGNPYEGNFSVREQDYITSRKEYFKYSKTNTFYNWGELYKYLATSDTPKLDLILAKLSEIKASQNLNQFEFAEMVVSFIQDIPYSLVFGTACQSADNYEESIRLLLEQCPSCCIGNIPYGIQNPISFMGSLKGDCDTRTVIIYGILDHFGYDVAIMNSNYYKHSILGLHIPAKGKYKVHNGKRYYVWETTNKHFTIGTLSNNFDNMNHWNIVLTNT